MTNKGAKITFNPPLRPDDLCEYDVNDLIDDLEFLRVILDGVGSHFTEEQVFKLRAKFLILRKNMQDVGFIDQEGLTS